MLLVRCFYCYINFEGAFLVHISIVIIELHKKGLFSEDKRAPMCQSSVKTLRDLSEVL